MPILALVGVLFAFGTSGAVVAGNVRGPRPVPAYTWQEPPRLRFADDVPVATRVAAEHAWLAVMDLGAPAYVWSVGGGPVAQPGEVVITTIDGWDRPDNLGRTTVAVSGGYARSAVLELAPGATVLVVEHELLAHVFGFGHVSRAGHVLATGERLGPSTAGIVFAP